MKWFAVLSWETRWAFQALCFQEADGVASQYDLNACSFLQTLGWRARRQAQLPRRNGVGGLRMCARGDESWVCFEVWLPETAWLFQGMAFAQLKQACFLSRAESSDSGLCSERGGEPGLPICIEMWQWNSREPVIVHCSHSFFFFFFFFSKHLL